MVKVNKKKGGMKKKLKAEQIRIKGRKEEYVYNDKRLQPWMSISDSNQRNGNY